jgi:hypothetical protein
VEPESLVLNSQYHLKQPHRNTDRIGRSRRLEAANGPFLSNLSDSVLDPISESSAS